MNRLIVIMLILLTGGIDMYSVLDYKYITASENDLYIEDSNGFYNYCPSIIKENSGVLHSFYCANETAFEVKDSIYYRKSLECDDRFAYSDKTKVLSPSTNSWDSVHVCDPSIIQGVFQYEDTNYKYLMSYLGCSTYDNQQNKIGFAVSNNLDNGWIKTDSINPVIGIPYDMNHKDEFQWGVGQPSLISVDTRGMTLIFYTQGTYNLTSEIVELWDLSDLNNPVQVWKTTLSNKGTNDFISNADFTYADGILYMVCDTHPFRGTTLSNIPDKSTIYKTSISDLCNVNSFSSCKWEYIYSLDKTITSYNKNHNTCFVRDEYGHFIESSVCYSYATELSDFLSSLWTYRFKVTSF